MRKVKIRKPYIVMIIMVLVFMAGSYFMADNLIGKETKINVSGASGKRDEAGSVGTNKYKQMQEDKKYVLEQDDFLIITGTDVNVSGKTFKQVKEEMEESAKKNGGIMGD